jgi:hypothetical protein
MSCGLALNLLQEILLIGNTINATMVHNKVHEVGQKIDKKSG